MSGWINTKLVSDKSIVQSFESNIIELNDETIWSAIANVEVVAAPNSEIDSVDTDEDTLSFAAPHELVTGQAITLITDDTLPAPLQVATNYYVIVVDETTISLATSLENALAGTAIDLTTAGAGTNNVNVFLSGATIKWQYSNDKTDWVDVAESSTSITESTVKSWNDSQVGFGFIKMVVAITAGHLNISRVTFHAKKSA